MLGDEREDGPTESDKWMLDVSVIFVCRHIFLSKYFVNISKYLVLKRTGTEGTWSPWKK